ncbi:DUF2945 domain-containing protein [Profundibacterium mesophilum]|uniref:Hypervirulence associated protein TUDOR domain-containing protein n=1 Tax=Profundibacterium mesophilum KAUST100406-0324 TaxID=1037889 RepID=A0A921NSN7_9RHOB|nr:DUF2945 domain-containing protein [Profundibacterium mesophilum]KAF0677285.1 hypothetical protein PMES_00332 [Profundibacterium mesophilum KAUST100406-0324]
MASYKIGETVEWSWGGGTAKGKITERFTNKVTRKLQGSEITRNATEDMPAYLIEQEDGAEVLKLASELN